MSITPKSREKQSKFLLVKLLFILIFIVKFYRFHANWMSKNYVYLQGYHPDRTLYVFVNKHFHGHSPSRRHTLHQLAHSLNQTHNALAQYCESIPWTGRKIRNSKHLPNPWSGPDITHVADESTKPCWRKTTGFCFDFEDAYRVVRKRGDEKIRCTSKI